MHIILTFLAIASVLIAVIALTAGIVALGVEFIFAGPAIKKTASNAFNSGRSWLKARLKLMREDYIMYQLFETPYWQRMPVSDWARFEVYLQDKLVQWWHEFHCYLFGHQLEVDGWAGPDSGGETIYCTRCGWQHHAIYY